MRIFIASSDEKLRLALLLFLENETGMIVVGLSDRISGLLTQLAGSQPDILILDGELSSQPVKDLLLDYRIWSTDPGRSFSPPNPGLRK